MLHKEKIDMKNLQKGGAGMCVIELGQFMVCSESATSICWEQLVYYINICLYLSISALLIQFTFIQMKFGAQDQNRLEQQERDGVQISAGINCFSRFPSVPVPLCCHRLPLASLPDFNCFEQLWTVWLFTGIYGRHMQRVLVMQNVEFHFFLSFLCHKYFFYIHVSEQGIDS